MKGISLLTGVTNMSFPLSDQPVLGEWFVFVEMQGHVYNKSFEVQKYGKWGLSRPGGVLTWGEPQTREGRQGWRRVTPSPATRAHCC